MGLFSCIDRLRAPVQGVGADAERSVTAAATAAAVTTATAAVGAAETAVVAAAAVTATTGAITAATKTATTATATGAAETASAGRTSFHGASFIHHQAATTQGLTVHAFNSSLRF